MAQFVRIGLPECEAPLPYCFVGHDDLTLSEKLFDQTEN